MYLGHNFTTGYLLTNYGDWFHYNISSFNILVSSATREQLEFRIIIDHNSYSTLWNIIHTTYILHNSILLHCKKWGKLTNKMWAA